VLGRRLAAALAGLLLLPEVAGASRQALRLPASVYRTVAVVAGGRIYVLGAHDSGGGTISDVYVVDPARGTSRRAGTKKPLELICAPKSNGPSAASNFSCKTATSWVPQ
jgi:hypothetical protein